MQTRLSLHNKLLLILPNVYFQPPSDIRMVYPCIVYAKMQPQIDYANNHHYKKDDEYQVTVMDTNPESTYAEEIVDSLPYSSITSRFIMNNINHTTIKLYY